VRGSSRQGNPNALLSIIACSKVARTIADLAASEAVTAAHGAEAVQYRRLEKPNEEMASIRYRPDPVHLQR
jgi:hypothetical protein